MESPKQPIEAPPKVSGTLTTTPAWWADHQKSGWDRVKEAFRRDWEQTKADFSKKTGHDLNQNVADTVKEAVGSKPVPPLAEKTRPAKMDQAVTSREDARAAWSQAEREASYGFAARAQYPQFTEWSPALEATLRGEWIQLNPDHSWEEARAGIRRGWDFSQPQKH